MTFADALRALSDLAGSELSLRAALIRWHEYVDGPLRAPVEAVARRLRLGADPATSLAPLMHDRDARMLQTIVKACVSAGGSAPRLLRDLADSIDRREVRRRQAQAAAAAARASNRLLIGLPLVVLPVFAASGVPIFDALGLAFLTCGGAIALAGARWVERLTPGPPEDDISVRVATSVAVLLRAGADLHGALDVVARLEEDPHLDLARSWVALGRQWPSALAATSHEGLAALGRLVHRSRTTGVAAADTLEHFITSRRLAGELSFERNARAAPVRMVVPLVTCGLPAFCLIVLAPMLRSVPNV